MSLHEAVKHVRTDGNIRDFTSKSMDIVEKLVLDGANVNEKNEFGQTPLLLAMEGLLLSDNSRAFRIHEKMIAFLKDSGAYVDDENNGTYELTLIRTAPFKFIRNPKPQPDGIKEFKLVLGVNTYYGLSKTPGVIDAVIANDEMSLVEALEGEDASSEMFPTKLTALHFACWYGYAEIAKILLNAGGNPRAEDHFGLTPLMIATAMGHGLCLTALIDRVGVSDVNRVAVGRNVEDIRRPSPRVDYLMNMPLPVCQWTTLLHEAVKSNSSNCVSILLGKGADSGAKDTCGNVPLIYAGARLKACNNEEICFADNSDDRELEPALESDEFQSGHKTKRPSVATHGKNFTVDFSEYKRIVSMLIDADGKSKHFKNTLTLALINSVTLKAEAVVKLLLDKGADPYSKNEHGTTALHEAAAEGSKALLELFLGAALGDDDEEENVHPLRTIDVVDSHSFTPLHRAAYWGHRDCISFLVKSGANLSLENFRKLSALEIILVHVDRSKSFVLSLMDECVSCKPAPKWEGDFFLELDFGWISNENDVRQTAVIKSLLRSTVVPKGIKKDILEHPLVESFCRIKWHQSRMFFFAVVLVHVLYVVSLSLSTMFEYLHLDQDAFPNSWARAFRIVHMVFAFVVFLNAVNVTSVGFNLDSLRRRHFEAPVLGFVAALSIAWAQTSMLATSEYVRGATTQGWAKVMLIFMIPLAWMALMLMIGRYRAWGSRALLFGVVLKNIILTFCVLGLIIIGFSFSFFVLFHNSKPELFGNPWRSLVSTLVMMTGEYNYSDLSSDGLSVSTRFLFLIFVVVASLVINNLVVALAVTDAQSLSTVGEWLCLRKKLEFTNALECVAIPLARRCTIPRKMQFLVSGSEEIGYRVKTRELPKRVVKSLMDLAMRKREKDDRVGVVNTDVVIWFPEAVDGDVELRIKNARVNLVGEVLKGLYTGAERLRESDRSSRRFFGKKVLLAKKDVDHFREEV